MRFRGDRQSLHKSLRSKLLNVFVGLPVVETRLLGDVEDGVFAFEAHHDLFDGAVQVPIFSPIDPQAVTREKDGTPKRPLGDVVRGENADDLFGNVGCANEHLFIHDVEIVFSGVIFIVGEAVERDAGYIHARSVDDALVVGGGGGKISFIDVLIAQYVFCDAVEQMIVLAGVMPRQLILVARHLHEDAALQIRDQVFVIR